MNRMVGRIFITLGSLFIILGFVIYRAASFDMQLGMIWNIFVFAWDCLWFIGTGIFLIVVGIGIYKGYPDKIRKIEMGGYFIIFNFIFFIFSFIFNHFAEPAFQSNGRLFTYCIQSIPRLFRPSLSLDFFVPFSGIVIFIVTCVLFRRLVAKNATRE